MPFLSRSCIFLRSLVFNILLFAWMGFVVGLALPLALLPSGVVEGWIRLWSRVSLKLCRIVGITWSIEGQQYLDKALQEGCIVACRHESLWETMVFHTVLARPRYVLKKQLTDIPLYGTVLKKLGSITVDRDSGARSVMHLMRQTSTALKGGGTLVIFPEGTRMAPGQVSPLKPGVFVLYRAAQKPVVPAMVNSGSFWPRRGFLKFPGHIILAFLPPVPPGLDRDTFMHHLEDSFAAAQKRLEAEGRVRLLRPGS